MEDQSIIDLYWTRSESAVTETAEKYGSRLSRLAWQITGSREDAEECTNDTYHAAWNAIPPTRPTYLFAYLAKIVRNFALGRLAYAHAEKRNRELTLLFEELEECIAAPNEEESQLESEEISKILNAFLRSLKVEKRVIFVRRYWYALSIRELSVQFGMKESKVKSILFRLRKQLRQCLEREGIVL